MNNACARNPPGKQVGARLGTRSITAQLSSLRLGKWEDLLVCFVVLFFTAVKLCAVNEPDGLSIARQSPHPVKMQVGAPAFLSAWPAIILDT